MTNLQSFNNPTVEGDFELPNDPAKPTTNSFWGFIEKTINQGISVIQQKTGTKPPVVAPATDKIAGLDKNTFYIVAAVIVVGLILLLRK